MDVKPEKMNITAENMLRALDNTDISFFMYYPKERKVMIPEKVCRYFQCDCVYTDMPESFAQSYVHPDDRAGFIEMYSRIHNAEKTASSKFRSMDQRTCVRDTLTTVAWDESGNPEVVIGVISDASDSYQNDQLAERMQERIHSENADGELAEVMQVIAAAISGQYYAIYHIWVESRTYICFHEKMEGVLSAIGEKGAYDPAWDIYVKNYIVPEDQAALREFAEISTLPERLRNHHSISHTYRRNGIGWTRGTFFAGKRDENGNVTNVIYSVMDINAEVELEEKQKQAAYEAEHDALTGVYNRKGFDALLTSKQLQGVKAGKVGFAILDIDNFKSLNDNFGHAIGDQVLIAVAKQLTSVFYPNDIIARIGGDEFAILLPDCDASAWNKICSKFQAVHTILANSFHKTQKPVVTLSVGITFSASGYLPQLYQLADEGLYETKKLGRAGCTLIGSNHEVLNHWQDETLSFHAKNVLEYNNTGLCQIEIPNDPGKPRRMICSDAAKQVLGIPKSTSPEECYALWRDRIDPAYRETLAETERSMIEYGQTECTFLWNHPVHGKIHLRCGGYGEKKPDRLILSGYCHTLKDTHIIEHQDDQAQILHAINETYVATYYLDLENDTASAFKLAPSIDYPAQNTQSISELMTEFISTIIDPRDHEIMQSFMNVNTLQKRLGREHFLDAEYRSLLLNSWCRARLLPVRYNSSGKLSHALLTITALDRTSSKERTDFEYHRKSLSALFNNVPGGVVMYEWDGKKLQTLHISNYYEKEYDYILNRDEAGERKIDYSFVHPDDLAGYQKAIAKALTQTHELHYEFRRWNKKQNRYVWVHLDATSAVQPDGNSLVFALYTDVTERKEAELIADKRQTSLLAALDASNQLCYEYDPATHIGECLTEENFFHLPKHIENYPDSLKEIDLFHPEDADTFINTAHQIDQGAGQAQCDVRIKRDGNYGWYSCTFNRYFDSEKERYVAILTVVDITLRITTKKAYEDRLRSLSAITENTLCLSLFNLTKETYELVACQDSVRSYVQNSLPLREHLQYPADGIVSDADRRKYRALFDVDYLLQQMSEGKAHHELEYLLKLSPEHYEWVFTAIDLMQNPLTGDIIGAVYSKSQQADKMNQLLLKQTLEQDYAFAALIFVDTDEFYLYNPHKATYSKRMQNYWDVALNDAHGHCSEEVEKELKRIFVKQTILDHLQDHPDFSYAYDGFVSNQTTHRLEIRFSYADAAHTMLLASMRNITDISLMGKYRHDSEHDALTGLYNRKKFISECEKMLKEHPEEQFAMIHFDLKNFHRYNTFFGDAAGDQLLCDLADVLRAANGDYDHWVYGRIDADVFCSMVPFDQKLYEKHTQAAFRYLSAYRNDYLLEPKFGLYLINNPEMPIESMITRAAIPAKKEQTNTTGVSAVYNDKMEEQLQTEQEIINEMQNALEQGQFQVYLQPKYSLRTSQPTGAEALVRWIHPVKGVISPAKFIPIFEKNGFIANLDRYMWEQTCILLRKWMDEGKTVDPISINVSRISIFAPYTVSFLKGLVEKYRIEPGYLELELTESAYVESPEEILSRLADLQQYGFKILMDDFGSGYSSLNTLKDLPIDVLKLDMKFLSSDKNERGNKILVSVIRMSKLLNIPVIAEGVETREQADYLCSIGCEFVQGYLYARPMPVADYEKEIANTQSNTDKGVSNAQRYSPIFDVLLSDTTDTQLIDNAIPSPLALIGCRSSQFTLLRANRAFIDTFGLRDDLRPANRIIQEHLSAEDYDRVLRAFQNCSETKASVSFHMGWNNDNDDTVHQYLVNVVYEGYVGTEDVFVTAFIDEKPKDYFV